MTATQPQIDDSASCSSADTELVLIPQDGVARVSDAVRPFFAKLIPELRGTATVDDLIDQAARGELQIWLAYSPGSDDIYGIQLTTLQALPQMLVCRLIGTAGHRMLEMNVPALLAQIEEWATYQKCGAIVCEGRSGWRRYLKGYAEVARVWHKELPNGR